MVWKEPCEQRIAEQNFGKCRSASRNPQPTCGIEISGSEFRVKGSKNLQTGIPHLAIAGTLLREVEFEIADWWFLNCGKRRPYNASKREEYLEDQNLEIH